MQLLTGTISPETRHDLSIGTVFRTVSDSYGTVRRYLTLIEGRWPMGDKTYYDISYVEIGATYSARITTKAIPSDDSFLDTIQHVEYEEADAEFRRQTETARKRVLECQVALMEAESVRDSFWAMGDRLGG